LIPQLRILILNQYYPPDTANTARLLKQWADRLAEQHEVRLVAGRPSYAPDARFDDGAVEVRRVASFSGGRRGLISRAFGYLSYLALATFRGVAEPRPDVVVAMTDPPIVGLAGAIVALRFRRPLVVVVHDIHPDIGIAIGTFREGALVKAWRLLNRLIRRRASSLIVVGRDMLRKLAAEGVPEAKLQYVPTWGFGEALPTEERDLLRRQVGFDGSFVVMHAGNMGLAQNLDVMPPTAEALVAEKDVRIVFLGDGPSRPRLQAEVERRGLSNVEFLDALPPSEAQALMSAADIHVVSLVPGLWGCATPSKTYGIMAAGRPYVAAVDSGSEPELLADEFECGMRVPAGDSDALATAIRQIRSAPLEEMGKRARGGYEARFTANRCTADLSAAVIRAGRRAG
jgi:glycosyltransferase involved in cell wall biosynthesis